MDQLCSSLAIIIIYYQIVH